MMLRPQGYACVVDPDTGTKECDTMTCGHCQRLTHVKPKMRPEDMGGLCKVCMGLICSSCVGHECVPFLKRIEQEEERYHARRSYGG